MTTQNAIPLKIPRHYDTFITDMKKIIPAILMLFALELAPAQFLAEKMFNARSTSVQVYGPEKTFNDFTFTSPLKSCIDYIFTSRDPRIKVRKFATLTDSYNQKYPSDHLPVIADLLIQKN